jgi:branched-chain amino acid transport system substrate-binding protein
VAKYGHEPDQFAAQAYDAMYVLHQAVEQSGTTTDRKKFRDTLAKISDFEGATGKFAFDENRDPKMDLAVLEVKGGKWVPLGE